ncbi:MAG: hypothetical protein H0T45_00740 [Pyrinomonadaceae bacterium]|nr:hypothetical protein [Pyrinomonadaceae bacterium]
MNTFAFLLDEEIQDSLAFAPFLPGQSDEDTSAAGHQAAPPVEEILSALLDDIAPGEFREAMTNIFSDLTRLFGYLSWIETYLRGDSPLADAVPMFILVHGEARALVDSIETSTSELANLPAPVREVLDCISYAINFELRRTCPHELQALETAGETSQLRAAIERAHGALCNCFQQLTIELARVFDPTLNGARLFDDYQLRRQQSLTLCDDLVLLVELVRLAEEGRDQASDAFLVECLKEFGEGSIRYLLSKDWETFGRCVEEIEAARGTEQWHPALHRFGCYLETLLEHVRKRAVLAEQDDISNSH